MSVNHRERIERIVDKALKEKALGEPYGFYVCTPSFWPIKLPQPDGTIKDLGEMPAWFVMITIRGGLGEPDLGEGLPVPGTLPSDDEFVAVAQGLFEACIWKRKAMEEQAKQEAKAIATLDAQRQQAQSGSGLAVASKGQSK